LRGVAVTLACFALVALLLAWSRWLARRRLASLGHAALAAACVLLGALLWAATDSLASFQPLRPGLAIARIRFDEVGPGRYRATLVRLPQGRVQVFEMAGDSWRIEARTLVWHGLAADLGLQPACRLERLESGPASSVASAGAAGSSYALSDVVGMDVWSRVRGHPGWARYAEAGAADLPWQPIKDGQQFTVVMAGLDLAAEPVREDAGLAAARR
jgi:hypothetical protein